MRSANKVRTEDVSVAGCRRGAESTAPDLQRASLRAGRCISVRILSPKPWNCEKADLVETPVLPCLMSKRRDGGEQTARDVTVWRRTTPNL
jgi:hypothetical protein